MDRIRTCIGCAAKEGKMTYHRIVRMPDGTVVFDPSGRKPGRGAYVCSSQCFAKARKTKRLESALRCQVPQAVYDEIATALEAAEAPAGKE